MSAILTSRLAMMIVLTFSSFRISTRTRSAFVSCSLIEKHPQSNENNSSLSLRRLVASFYLSMSTLPPRPAPVPQLSACELAYARTDESACRPSLKIDALAFGMRNQTNACDRSSLAEPLPTTSTSTYQLCFLSYSSLSSLR
jgi:hypothetical protein